MNHTKLPWVIVDSTEINDADGFLVCDTASSNYELLTDKQNARRIVACVNACIGIGAESLERFNESHKPENGFGLHRETNLEAQRDELLDAIKTYGKHQANCLGDLSGRSCTCGLDKAIAKCEKPTQ